MNTGYYAIPGLNRIEVMEQIDNVERSKYKLADITPQQIINIVIRHLNDYKGFNYSFTDIIQKSRANSKPLFRQAGYYYLRTYTRLSLKEVAQRLGGFDHSTVIHGVREWGNYVSTYRTAIALDIKIVQAIKEKQRELQYTNEIEEIKNK